MQHKHLWYTRRGANIRGPFPAGLITRYLILGRILETDEISVDQQEWRRVMEVPGMVPEVMHTATSEEVEKERIERLMLAKRWEDERLSSDRRTPDTSTNNTHPQRRADDRRRPEPPELLQHRSLSSKTRKSPKPRENYRPQIIIATVVLTATAALAIYYPNEAVNPSSQCNAVPQPKVNWNNCPLEGASLKEQDLSGAHVRNANLIGANLRAAKLSNADIGYTNLSNADLSYADLTNAILVGATLRNTNLTSAKLQGADLSYANLSGANLGGADLSNVKLDKTIWFDGTACAVGSRGECQSAASASK